LKPSQKEEEYNKESESDYNNDQDTALLMEEQEKKHS
jgi:hypothetical protein